MCLFTLFVRACGQECEMINTRIPVVLVIGELNVVFPPSNCWRRVGNHVTFQIHIVLQRLS